MLQEEAETMEVSKLHEKACTLYEYISVKESVTTFMQVKPPKLLLEKHVDGLGFGLENPGEKNAKILLKSKDKGDSRKNPQEEPKVCKIHSNGKVTP